MQHFCPTLIGIQETKSKETLKPLNFLNYKKILYFIGTFCSKVVWFSCSLNQRKFLRMHFKRMSLIRLYSVPLIWCARVCFLEIPHVWRPFDDLRVLLEIANIYS